MSIIKRIRVWFTTLYTSICDWFTNSKTKNRSSKNANENTDESLGGSKTTSKTNSKEKSKSNTKKPIMWRAIICNIVRFIFQLVQGLSRCITIGIILNVVAAYFYPELPERIPIIFGWYDGCMQFGEFVLKSAFGYINAFFHGNAMEFIGEIDEQIQVMWTQFVNWLSTIHF